MLGFLLGFLFLEINRREMDVKIHEGGALLVFLAEWFPFPSKATSSILATTHGFFAIRAYTAAGTSSEAESYESDADELSTIPRSWGLPWPAISMDAAMQKREVRRRTFMV